MPKETNPSNNDTPDPTCKLFKKFQIAKLFKAMARSVDPLTKLKTLSLRKIMKTHINNDQFLFFFS